MYQLDLAIFSPAPGSTAFHEGRFVLYSEVVTLEVVGEEALSLEKDTALWELAPPYLQPSWSEQTQVAAHVLYDIREILSPRRLKAVLLFPVFSYN